MTGTREARVTLIYGRKGQGKSYLAKVLAAQRGRARPVVVWDPQREWAGPRARDARIRLGIVHDFQRFLADMKGSKLRRVPNLAFQLEQEEFGAFVFWVQSTGHLCLIVDEAHLVAPPFTCPKTFLRLVRTCRHSNVDMVIAAQRPTSVHGDVRAQADEVYAFQTSEPRDLQYFGDFCGKPFAEALTAREVGSPCYWQAGQGTAEASQ